MDAAASMGAGAVVGAGLGSGIRRNRTHYEESSVAKVFEELDD